ncbi:hypothetical protein MA16_Dca013054 [Dendrobium catenatum]|uniref:Uncharacterized protein n=1 Tax=Dendrobium catenatum TaxID=906689 RepID=A0A2I0X143_9ASPA|nr:hypothetical protein MA16_Dca013054 [Dendrobium catenatum]
MGDRTSTKDVSVVEDRPTARSEGSKKAPKATKADNVISTITEESFISFRKKFHFPNDLVMKVPVRSERACFPPQGYVTMYEFSLRAGLRFPPPPELVDILTACALSLSQFSYRAMSVVVGLIVFFRDHRAVLSTECLSWMGRIYTDPRVEFPLNPSGWMFVLGIHPKIGLAIFSLCRMIGASKKDEES